MSRRAVFAPSTSRQRVDLYIEIASDYIARSQEDLDHNKPAHALLTLSHAFTALTAADKAIDDSDRKDDRSAAS